MATLTQEQETELTEILEIVDEVFEESERKRYLQTVESWSLEEAKAYLIKVYDAWKEREKKYLDTVRSVQAVYENALDYNFEQPERSCDRFAFVKICQAIGLDVSKPKTLAALDQYFGSEG